MERRNLLAGLAVLALSLFMLSGTAFAHATHHKKAKPRSGATSTTPAETCVVHSEPGSFMDQGEFGSASSVADIIEVECEPVYAEKYVHISDNELYSQCADSLYWRSPYGHDEGANQWGFVTGRGISVELDNDGNATAIVLGGPSCAAATSLVAAHLEAAPYTTFTTAFNVLPPRVTPEGVTVVPGGEGKENPPAVESETTSSVATIAQVEFNPVFAEEPVNLDFAQLAARCKVCPYTEVITMGENGYPSVQKSVSDTTLYLDNDGNAFAILIGNASCASGSSLIEASLENAPYTTVTTNFTITPPEVTFSS
jgi:hypothetical protein